MASVLSYRIDHCNSCILFPVSLGISLNVVLSTLYSLVSCRDRRKPNYEVKIFSVLGRFIVEYNPWKPDVQLSIVIFMVPENKISSKIVQKYSLS